MMILRADSPPVDRLARQFRPTRRFRPTIDALDPRALLSTAGAAVATAVASISVIDLGLQGKVLNVQGTDDRDVIVITDRAVHLGSQALTIAPDVIGIYVDGNGGDDVILNLQGGVPVILHGGAGNDFIRTVPADGFFSNIVYGDEGLNVILGDPTRSTIYAEAVNYLTVDPLGQSTVVFFYDASGDSSTITVFTDAQGNTVVQEPTGETYLPPDYLVGVFDLGPGNDAFADLSPAFRTIVYGGDGSDTIVADEVHD